MPDMFNFICDLSSVSRWVTGRLFIGIVEAV